MKMKRYDFTSFEQFEESGVSGEYEALTVIDEKGWLKSDIMTECKSWKTALRRFFKMLGEDPRLDGWYECMRESGESGYFKLNDFTMGNGSRNEFPGYAYEIEEVSEGVWYIFLNVRYEPYTETETDNTDNKEEEKKMEFTMIKANVSADGEKRISDTAFYIENGFMPSWANEHHNEPDRGLKQYSTETRWGQYQRGEISREKAVKLATKRAVKDIEKDTARKLARLDRVAQAEDLKFISISVEWVRSRTWGYNPRVEAQTNDGFFSGAASGCGYDKESAAIAEALNQSDSVMKALFTLKENGLREGKTDESKTATCGRSNGDICGYGAGYGAIPYFEGGVGSSCFWAILKKCGFKVSGHHGKHSDYYTLEKEVA